ncbi:MAG: inovirus Gp2 family protein [Gammaproteobacteria bacterium]|nr:inovirus Gp2 family protein [Gammaproteobacteria bacterium]
MLKKKQREYKQKHFNSLININGEELKIKSSEQLGVYPKIIERYVEQLDICIARFKRVFVIRFDLHADEYTSDNKRMEDFIRRQKRRIQRNYNTKDIAHTWVREVSSKKKLHYHCTFFIDGKKIQHPEKLLAQIRAKWKHGHVPYFENMYYYIDTYKEGWEEVRADVIERLSYLAKTSTKGYRNPQTKCYSASRLSKN